MASSMDRTPAYHASSAPEGCGRFRPRSARSAETGERLAPDVARGAEHGVAEAPGVALAGVVHVGGHDSLADPAEPLGVALGLQRRLELPVAVEVVLDRVLVPPGHEQHVVQPGRDGLLDDVLDGRLVDDRQHLLGSGLGRRQEPGAETRDRDDCLGDGWSVLLRHGTAP